MENKLNFQAAKKKKLPKYVPPMQPWAQYNPEWDEATCQLAVNENCTLLDSLA